MAKCLGAPVESGFCPTCGEGALVGVGPVVLSDPYGAEHGMCALCGWECCPSEGEES